MKGSAFSPCGNYRYALWRIWDDRPLVMFIGLNPSKADSEEDDPTIKSVTRIAKANGYGGVYMMNCFPFISTNPDNLQIGDAILNDQWLARVGGKCQDVVFAWGNFKVVSVTGRDLELEAMFPNALALVLNKNGSPRHPLYCKSDTKFVKYRP